MCRLPARPRGHRASTRPPFFTAEVPRGRARPRRLVKASTRPPFFTAEVGTGTEDVTTLLTLQRGRRSSRRRSFFRGSCPTPRARCFNEAAVLHGGGPSTTRSGKAKSECFNEAAVLHGGGRAARAMRGDSTPALQRGRRSSRRRSVRRHERHYGALVLQRGRRSSRRRSRSRPPPPTPRFRCFNEAAVLHGGGRSEPRRSRPRVRRFNEAAVLHGGGLARTRGRMGPTSRFNEAAVLHGGGRRAISRARSDLWRFNEAAVLHGGGPRSSPSGLAVSRFASTRPPFFTAEVNDRREAHQRCALASTRPPFFTAEVFLLIRLREPRLRASTRPPFFTAEVTPLPCASRWPAWSFNEAAVLHGGGPLSFALRGGPKDELQRGRRSSRRRSANRKGGGAWLTWLQRGRRSSRRRSSRLRP